MIETINSIKKTIPSFKDSIIKYSIAKTSTYTILNLDISNITFNLHIEGLSIKFFENNSYVNIPTITNIKKVNIRDLDNVLNELNIFTDSICISYVNNEL